MLNKIINSLKFIGYIIVCILKMLWFCIVYGLATLLCMSVILSIVKEPALLFIFIPIAIPVIYIIRVVDDAYSSKIWWNTWR